MFESAELGHSIEKTVYDQEVPALREALLDAQYDLASARKVPVVILIAGVDGAGKSATVNTLNEWMDPRHILTHGLSDPSDEELERPHMWRFWRQLPPKGKLGIFDGSWYSWAILEAAHGRIKGARLDQSLEQIRRFEQMLIDEGALVLKFWMHLSKQAQKKRLKKLEGDPLTRWRVTDRDWKHFEMYDTFRDVAERALRNTSTAEAPWIVVEAADPRYQKLTVGRTLLERLRARIDEPAPRAPVVHAPAPAPSIDGVNILHSLDLTRKVEKAEYEKELEKWQGRLNLLTRHKAFKDHNVVLVFEGADAAGKGGSIRRITQAIDARLCEITPIAAPTEEERAQPYLWRFWRRLPRKGRFAIFDRSWYGRVLVERVEGFCTEADWMRAYGEICDFEDQMARSGTIVAKFWLAISKEEQLRRFNERQESKFKRFKITDEDWRNREKWDAYEAAICDMLDRTSTEIAPWTLVESEDKFYGRLKILRTLCARVEAAL
ncbi:polyphosphate:AMP phosphotransferase [Mesoterricola silvestris]|uniref:Polyphosphate:AMP phosphotransferase n=1 Tax=Mesoterricola silvestris TaxID=2927979 RepID=A0AA48GGA1_9BACT|nr:polyphosphate:AMP phosphotransferase [Mesoterricola silvestris]BDU72236.1 polyphosphate:AMP phosphotransferase [Mesoterricola silvestris]